MSNVEALGAIVGLRDAIQKIRCCGAEIARSCRHLRSTSQLLAHVQPRPSTEDFAFALGTEELPGRVYGSEWKYALRTAAEGLREWHRAIADGFTALQSLPSELVNNRTAPVAKQWTTTTRLLFQRCEELLYWTKPIGPYKDVSLDGILLLATEQEELPAEWIQSLSKLADIDEELRALQNELAWRQGMVVDQKSESTPSTTTLHAMAEYPPPPDASENPEQFSSDGPSGFLGVSELFAALGIPESQQDNFAQALSRNRRDLGDSNFHEVREPRPNAPKFLYRANAPELLRIAKRYQKPKAG